MTPLAYLRHVFAETGDPREPIWPKRWRLRADEYWMLEMLGRSGISAKGMGTMRRNQRHTPKPLASPVPSGVDANRYTSRKRDAA